MEPRDFADYHRAALERNEVRHNVILAMLARIPTRPRRGMPSAPPNWA